MTVLPGFLESRGELKLVKSILANIGNVDAVLVKVGQSLWVGYHVQDNSGSRRVMLCNHPYDLHLSSNRHSWHRDFPKLRFCFAKCGRKLANIHECCNRF